MKPLRLTVLLAGCALFVPAHARITEINVRKIEPFAGGATFGNAGAYERVWGVAKGELDPADPRASLEERYASHAKYVKKVEAAARALVRERLLLAEDAERYVKAARDESVAKLFAR